MTKHELINYRDAAKQLGLPLGTLYAMVHQNRIPHIRLGRRLVRFDPRQLEEFIDAHRVETAASRSGTGARSSAASLLQPVVRARAEVTEP